MQSGSGIRIISSVRASETRATFNYEFPINFDEVTPTPPARQGKVNFMGRRTSAPVYTVRPIVSVRGSETRAVY